MSKQGLDSKVVVLIGLFLVLGFSGEVLSFDVPTGLTGLEEGPMTEYIGQEIIDLWAFKVQRGDYGPVDSAKKKLVAITELLKEETNSTADCCAHTQYCDRYSLKAKQLFNEPYLCRSGCTQFGIMFVALARELGVKVLYVSTTRLEEVRKLRGGDTSATYDGHFYVAFFSSNLGNWVLYNPNATSGKRLVGDETNSLNGYTVSHFRNYYDPSTGKGIKICKPDGVCNVSNHIAVDPAAAGSTSSQAHKQIIEDTWLNQ